jgi:serine/threonine-protein kinase
MPDPPPSAPRVVGRYSLGAELSSGGFGTVHVGRLVGPVGFARTVAIKRLHAGYARDERFASMFVDEALLAARVRHPNVVATLDVVVEDGELSVVLEHVHGVTLAELTRLARAAGERLPVGIAAAIVAGALDGLHAAHEATSEQGQPLGLVHRDVSPENVLVGADGVARVLDFGFARAAGRLHVSTEGVLKGKVAYMAPEQIVSDTTSRRSDVYAAGVVLWEALAGRRLFEGDTVGGLVGQMLLGDVEPPSRVAEGVPEALDAVVLCALSPIPEARFATARDMALALEQAVPLATAREVAAFVERVAREPLEARAAIVSRVEKGAGAAAAAVPVTAEPAPRASSATPRAAGAPRSSGRGLALVLVGLALLSAFVAHWRIRATLPDDLYTLVPPTARPPDASTAPAASPAASAQAHAPRLAVLPLATIAPGDEEVAFADGLTEELISRLSRVRGLEVIARTSVTRLRGSTLGVAEIGRRLRAERILEGSVRRAGDRLRITVQLVDAATEAHLWAEDFDGGVSDVLATQTTIAERVAEAMHLTLVGGAPRHTERGARDPEGYVLYLKGLSRAADFTAESQRAAIDLFRQAIARSPDDARSWAALARAYALLGLWAFAPPRESFAEAEIAAQKALALDETDAEAHVALGLVRFLYLLDFPNAERSFRRALELDPASADAHLFYGVWLKAVGRFDEARARIRRANELSPLYLMANAELGWVEYYAGDLEGAVRGCRRTLEMDPDYLFALVCVQMAQALRRDPEAITLGQRIDRLTGHDPYFVGLLGWAYALQGREREARAILGELTAEAKRRPLPPPATYYVHMGLGDAAASLDGLEATYAERWGDVAWIKTAPEYTWLRSEPRFRALLDRLGLGGP